MQGWESVCRGMVGMPLLENKRVSRFLGFLVSRFLGSLVSWFLGFLVSDFLSFLISWFLGHKVSKIQNSFHVLFDRY